ncbi:MAG: hypothetical protein K2O32_14945 [Acetatifactor sp.]|nr:hypothetical protein [Acetatifactor sp.]
MLDKRYYEGYEGEGEVKVWSDNNGVENGMIIWRGFFETILEGCFRTEFLKNGINECYYNQDGFYDNKWEMQFPSIVLQEIKRFDENMVYTKSEEIINKSKEVIVQLTLFINSAIENGQKIYVEYI